MHPMFSPKRFDIFPPDGGMLRRSRRALGFFKLSVYCCSLYACVLRKIAAGPEVVSERMVLNFSSLLASTILWKRLGTSSRLSTGNPKLDMGFSRFNRFDRSPITSVVFSCSPMEPINSGRQTENLLCSRGQSRFWSVCGVVIPFF